MLLKFLQSNVPLLGLWFDPRLERLPIRQLTNRSTARLGPKPALLTS